MRGRGWSLGALLIGLLGIAHPALLSGTYAVPGDFGDTRLVHFSLEHTYQWITGRYAGSFWDPPIFYPERNVAAGTDLMLTLGPFYWPWRTLGATPETAFVLWLVTVFGLGFLVFEAFLRQVGLAAPAAALGAFVFAFGSPRMANIQHPQLLAEVFPAFALLSIAWAISLRSRRRAGAAWVLAASFLAAQAWGAFYPFFFAVLAAGLAALGALAMRDTRRSLREILRRDAVALALAGALAIAILAPLAMRYRQTLGEHGPRPWPVVSASLPRWQTWFRHRDTSWAYGWSYATMQPSDLTRRAAVPHLGGMGLATTVLAFVGLLFGWRRPLARLVALVAVALVAVSMMFPGGFSLWRWVYEFLPGAQAIRVVTRIELTVLAAAAIGVAFGLDRAWARARRGGDRRSAVLVASLAALVVLEQTHSVPMVEVGEMRGRVTSVARHVDPACTAFAVSAVGPRRYSKRIEEDAMWAALVTGVPTVNGRYGHDPRGWKLRPVVRRPYHRPPAAFGVPMVQWLTSRGVDPAEVCWIDLHVPSRRPSGIARASAVPSLMEAATSP